jgi:hypothetical protein
VNDTGASPELALKFKVTGAYGKANQASNE